MDMKKALWQLLPIIQMKRNLTVAFDLLFLYMLLVHGAG